jgi:hypothetical protein
MECMAEHPLAFMVCTYYPVIASARREAISCSEEIASWEFIVLAVTGNNLNIF